MEKHKVVSVTLSKRRPKRHIVKLDDGSVFKISEDAFVLHPIYVDDILTEEEIESLFVNVRQQEAINAAYYLLNFRMRSTAELRRRLLQKGFQTQDIEYTLDMLSEKGYLNDEEFAHAFALEKVRKKHIGPVALKIEFRPHGINPDLLDGVLTEVYNKFNITELIEYHLRKLKFSQMSDVSPLEKKRLIDTLRRKGFAWDSIRETMVQFQVN